MSRQRRPARYMAPEKVPDVVDELVRRFVTEEDQAPGHKCGPSCAHRSTAPLLVRIRMLVPPGTSAPRENPGKPAKGVKPGSPAPWAAGPAELLDEVHHGAIRLSCRLRQALGVNPLTVSATRPGQQQAVQVGVWRDLRHGGIRALVDVARLLPLLEDVQAMRRKQLPRPRDPIGPLCPAAAHWTCPHTSCSRIVAGQVDQLLERIGRDVRRWHTDALVLTGHAARWARLGEIANPERKRCEGPACVDCNHETCMEVRRGKPRAFVAATCPWCHTPSLRQNPLTRRLVCMKPSCRDEGGNRPEWSEAQLRLLVDGIEAPA